MMGNEKKKQEIREYCRQLKLRAISEGFENAVDGCEDFIDYLHSLLSAQIRESDDRAIQRRIQYAHFPYRKYLDDLELDCVPPALRKRLKELRTLEFIEKGQNIIMTGNPGTGKTHTAIGLGLSACEAGYRVLFTTVPYLVTELKESNDKQKLRAYERRFEKYDLVIADELGYISFDREGADLLFSNLSLRAASKSTIVTSNLTFDRWDEVFGDAAITSAMVDRLTYKAILIDMEGDSYRLRETLRNNGEDFEYIKNAASGSAARKGGETGNTASQQ